MVQDRRIVSKLCGHRSVRKWSPLKDLWDAFPAKMNKKDVCPPEADLRMLQLLYALFHINWQR